MRRVGSADLKVTGIDRIHCGDEFSAQLIGEHASRLTRILSGQQADQVIAIAADLSDPQQHARLVQRIEDRLGSITAVVDGRTGSSRMLASLPTLHTASAA